MSVLPIDAASAQLLSSLQSDYDATTPDAHVIAQQIVYQGKQKNVPVPVKATDLAFAISQISHDHTTGSAGAPTLVLTLNDPRWSLLDSGFFAMDAKGQLLDFDINYPDGSRFWWRLHQISPQSDHTMQLTFVPRIVGELMGLFGPIKADRAKRTRAEFLKMLCAKVKDPQGPIEFYSRELDIKQPVGAVTTTSTSSSGKTTKKGKASKSPGLGANTGGLTAKGSPLDSTQQHFVNLIIQTCQQESAGTTVTQACVFAAICESDLGHNMGWDAQNPTYGGLLAGSQSNFGSVGSSSSDAVATAQIKAFVHGGSGYNSALSQQGTFKDIGQLAAHVEGCVVGGGGYGPNGYGQYAAENPAQVIPEAQAIVKAGGGGGSVGSGSSGVVTNQPYYFQINAGEDYWTGMNRLAQEVGWELIVDGDRIYYDSDTELIKQKVAAVIDRDDPTTFAWNYDWVNRRVATNFQIQVAMQLFEFVAGEVVQVENFGPASLGSMASPPLPGRWLISEIRHNGGDVFSTISLVQPTAPKPEPAPQTTTSSSTAGGSSISIGSLSSQTAKTAEAAFAAAQLLKSYNLTYTQSNRTLIKNVQKGSTYLDCSGSVSWVLLAAGFPLPGNVTWGGWAPVSGDYFAGGAGGALLAGPGQYMTIYANADHVFIRIHPQGAADMQGNTVSPLIGMRGFDFFPWNTPGCGNYGGPSGTVGYQQTHYAGC